MQETIARELVKAINGYRDHPNTRDVEATAAREGDDWVVTTDLGYRFTEVPDRLELTRHPCRCRARWCASGKVAPGLLEKIRQGQPAPV